MTQDELLALIDQAAEEGWTALDLSGEELTELPPEIGRLTQLETLVLGKWDKEQQGPEGIKGFKRENNRLIPIISDNLLTELPSEIKALTKLRQLDLSGNRWNGFPSIVAELQTLQELTLVQSTLTEIPESIAQLSSLTELDLSRNQITVISEAISQLSSLTELNLFRNQITSIPESITQLSSLSKLRLSRNQITAIPEAIAQLSSLTTLDLQNNQITAIPEVIAQLSSLTTLDLQNNQITAIPEAIAQLSSLTELDLSGNQITTIPEVIAQLSSLTTLNLSGNQITSIPETITQLSSLATLSLSGNQLTSIPEAITQLSSLTTLNLSGNQITSIPETITRLSSLTELDLFGNKITSIPEVISQLSSLTTLYLISNQITAIPESIAQLSSLTTLFLGGNQLTVIPEAITQLSNLTTLNLSSNQLTAIPESIAQLSSLTTLFLSSNQLTSIPESIAQLSSLSTLNLRKNKITTIPDAISQLSSLTVLDLHENQIEKIPSCLEDLSKLTTLDLCQNPLPISPEILAPRSPEKIFNYLRELRSGEKRQLNEAKLLLIGQGSVGKTSLINRLIHNRYNPQESQTDGLNVSEWPVTVNSNTVRLNVWDFGGQEIYHATHQFFLTKRSLYILTCNCRTSEDENRVEYWLKLIQSFGGNSPVIIVGNKYDEQPLDINRKALRDKYPNIKDILETSCQTGHGIDKLQTTIIREISQLNDVYNLLPLTWFEVKEQLEALEKDFITYSEYSCLCHDENVTAEQSKEQLIDLLHNLGLVLNFRDHPILKDTNVLNPDWVTTAIYALLSDEPLKIKNRGILSDDDLTRILDPQRYPTKRHPYLTELIQEFQLGFPLPDTKPKQFLLPGLLPKDEPEDTKLKGDTLDFQYHYRVLPESIISRFIVLIHENIYQNTYWRSGVMLTYKEGNDIYNIARIKADPEEKKIFIAINGKVPTRRAFLTLIRNTFKKIHNSFTNLEVTEWVPVPNYPDHEPLSYRNLLGLEKMNVQEYPIGTLGVTVNIRKLLDGYEPSEVRQQRRRKEQEKDDLSEQRQASLNFFGETHIHQLQGDNQSMSNTVNQYGKGDNIAGDKVAGDKIHTQINNSTDLAQATRDIKALFTELDQKHDKNTPVGQTMITAKAIEAIENQPTLKKRLVKAIKEGSAAAIESAIEHPATKPVIATIKGFIEA